MRRAAAVALLVAFVVGCDDDGGETRTGEPATASAEPTTTTTATATGTTATTAPDEELEPPTGAVSPIEAAKVVLTSAGSPNQACERYVTESFVETAYGGRANCIASRRRDALARSIVIGSVDAEGQQAHLVVVPKGGPYDGAKVEVEVIAEGNLYRVDALEADVPAGP